MWIASAAVALVFLLVGCAALLPIFVRHRIGDAAAKAGVVVTIERVGIGIDGVTLRGVVASARGVPGATVRIEEVVSAGLSGHTIRARGAALDLDGPWSQVAPALLQLYESNRNGLATAPGIPRTLSVVSARVRWRGIFGDSSHLEASGIDATVEWRGPRQEDVHANVGSFEFATKRGGVGPWSSTFDRTPSQSRIRLLLDPSAPEGPSALLMWGQAAATHLTVKIPRSPLPRLGLRTADFGIEGDPGPEIELQLEGGQSPTMRVEGSGRLNLFGLRLKNMKVPLDVSVDGFASGLPGKPLELERTTATFGPLVAAVTGTLTPDEFGFRLDAAWQARPIPCATVARNAAKSMGSVATALHEAARASGATRVTGAVSASGTVKFSTAAPDEITAPMVTRESCGLSLFGM